MMAVNVHGMRERGLIDKLQHDRLPALNREQGRPVMAGRGKAGQGPDAFMRREP